MTTSSDFDYSTAQSIPEIWPRLAQRADVADVVAVQDPHSQPPMTLTYRELYEQMRWFAAGLQAMGIRAGDHVALFADNSPRWLIADQGIMTAGAADAVRGTQADRSELLFILEHSDSVALVVQDQATLKKLGAEIDRLPLRFIVLLSDETPTATHSAKILNFSQLIELGRSQPLQPAPRTRQDLATLMYTSGTSGQPKGVMLSHGNLLSQVENIPAVAQPLPGERVLSILPIWHSYERSFEYFIFSRGCTQIYTNIRYVKQDLKNFQPYYMVSVPRIWESVYEGVQKTFRDQPLSKQKLIDRFFKISQRYVCARRVVQNLNLSNLHPSAIDRIVATIQMIVLWPLHKLGDRIVYGKVRAATGGQLKFIVSGGGSIADYLEDFYEIVGIPILGGYGLTETSPVTHVRRPWRNLRGADGQPIPHTETKIVDVETRHPLPPGQRGVVLLRGQQIMQGYYKNPEATAKAIDRDGWFDSGDLGLVTEQDDLVITGRAKDTIVLSNGENIEPQPIENACLRSPYIDQIMLVGQDERSLGALIVPNIEALKVWAIEQGTELSEDGQTGLTLSSPQVQELFKRELLREVKNRPGYRGDDRIGVFRILTEPFTMENGMMTQTLKIRRQVVMERYRDMIDEMFA
ncbi:AMP-binding protein [Microcoleus sp. FACHB-1515]|uniref:AMP-dependent synthetase/ligase n=1 Tax=Cyanophyceae TaxID=3028117 RepID=UPI00168436A2|nr:AMP-binding protein [Microcoleus sp. FACHB-1515]MBD2091416.1 AMP-binding protein [Microcoleus sp. FACHB-1515]